MDLNSLYSQIIDRLTAEFGDRPITSSLAEQAEAIALPMAIAYNPEIAAVKVDFLPAFRETRSKILPDLIFTVNGRDVRVVP